MIKLVGFVGVSPFAKEPFGNWVVRIMPEINVARLARKWEYAFTFNPERDLLTVLNEVCIIAARRWNIRLDYCEEITPGVYNLAGCYLLHFESAYKHARNYLGVSEDVHKRLKQHRSKRSKRSSKLTRAVAQSNIPVRIVALWAGKYAAERELKRQGNPCSHCGYCYERKQQQKRAYRERAARKNKEVSPEVLPQKKTSAKPSRSPSSYATLNF
jgi:predicted GIY-YIG superfamily endonuclease